MAQALIKLFPLGMIGRENDMFGCTINGKQYKVTPTDMCRDLDKPGIPVRVKGIRYTLHSVYSSFHSMYELYMFAATGPYKGFRGPKVGHSHPEVTLKEFNEHFSICLWKRERTSLWSSRCKTMVEAQAMMKEGWFANPPTEDISAAVIGS